jgi:hypothetical protein
MKIVDPKVLMVAKSSRVILARCSCGGNFEQVEYRKYETDAECNKCKAKITLIEIEE